MIGLCGLTWALPAVGRADEAMAIADETVAAAREYDSPFWIGWALGGYGRAFAESEPVRALHALREGLQYADKYRLGFWEANLAQDAARLEAVHGDFDEALALFSAGINSFHRRATSYSSPRRSLRWRYFSTVRPSRGRGHDLWGEHSPAEHRTRAPPVRCRRAPPYGARRCHLREYVQTGFAMDTAEAVFFAQEQISLNASSG